MTEGQLKAIADDFSLTEAEKGRIADLPLEISEAEINKAASSLNATFTKEVSLIDLCGLPKNNVDYKIFFEIFWVAFHSNTYATMTSFLGHITENVPVSANAIEDYLSVAETSSRRYASKAISDIQKAVMMAETIVNTLDSMAIKAKASENAKQESAESEERRKQKWKKA